MRDKLYVIFVCLWNLQRNLIFHKSYCGLVGVKGGINLNIVVLHIHTINTYRNENIHVYLH